jgi:hypothetical protein
MAASSSFLSDGGISSTDSSIQQLSDKDDTHPHPLNAKEHIEVKSRQQSNLTQKITSVYTVSDPFKNLYRTEWRAHTTPEEPVVPQQTKPTTSVEETSLHPRPDDASNAENAEELTYINGKFQNLTLKRVLALRKVQHAIQSAPNASAVGASSTAFAEDDLKCLTMEKLQSLQKRKRDLGKELQPLSVVKASIQAERSRKRLEPRDYQMELYERARRENTIAVLGTGTGKTLIACLLIKDILVQERVNRSKGMKVEYLVTVLTVEKDYCFCGALGSSCLSTGKCD